MPLGMWMLRDNISSYGSAFLLITAGMAAANIKGFAAVISDEDVTIFVVVAAVTIGLCAVMDILTTPSVPAGRLKFSSLVKLEQHKESGLYQGNSVVRLLILGAFTITAFVVMFRDATIVASIAKSKKELGHMSCDFSSPVPATPEFYHAFTSVSSNSLATSSSSAHCQPAPVTATDTLSSTQTTPAPSPSQRLLDEVVWIPEGTKKYYVCITNTSLPIPSAFAAFLLSMCFVAATQYRMSTYDNLAYKGMIEAIEEAGLVDFDITWGWFETSGSIMVSLYIIAALRFDQNTFHRRFEFKKPKRGSMLTRIFCCWTGSTTWRCKPHSIWMTLILLGPL
ncbi:hypothetical protein JKP88DRAFT_250925 [Tribonema minus]|uniref:Uncharacterized protein n=1 Tax=Tribonema minus TaxID=303371 RepID=A0A835ZDE9_9STRA|nr:hypothetical protein JKP88DRAFT_250925 [Tribonema minus]